MSIEVMRHVWTRSKSKGNSRLILLAIADNANELGDAFPGVNKLAAKGNMSVRTAQESIQELERLGELQVFEQVGTKTVSGWTNLYRVVMDGIKQPEVRTPTNAIAAPRLVTAKKSHVFPKEMQTVAPLSDDEALNEGVQTIAPHGVQSDSPHGVQTVAPKPSDEPPEQPSDSNANTHTTTGENVVVVDCITTSPEEIIEFKIQIPEVRSIPTGDEGEMDIMETIDSQPPPHTPNPVPSPLSPQRHRWGEFFTLCSNREMEEMEQEHGAPLVEAWMDGVRTIEGVRIPAAYVRAALRKGIPPPAQVARVIEDPKRYTQGKYADWIES